VPSIFYNDNNNHNDNDNDNNFNQDVRYLAEQRDWLRESLNHVSASGRI